jgi:mannose-6-phosphate isomerase-like protein (cupin superfamily)
MEDMLKKLDPSILRSTLIDDNNEQPSKKLKRTPLADEDANSDTKDDEDDAAPSIINGYTGWTVPFKNYSIPTVHIKKSNLTPEKFFQQYISERRPVVIQGLPDDLIQLQKWTNEYLIEKAGSESIMVEKRDSAKDSFGKGKEVPMKLEEFIQRVKEKDEMHYLTTQDVLSDEDGRADLMAPFMKHLKKTFPLVPELTRNLVPQNVNLWMGNNGEGTSSGLHHDYHDNLYIVLRGSKRFRLYAPDDVEHMYTRGELVKIHPNGRINYKGEETTAYGADLKADAAARASNAKDEAERMLEEAERGVKEGRSGAEDDLERAEEMMEAAMEALIDAEMGDSDDEEGCDEDEDDDDDAMGLFVGNVDKLDDLDSDGDEKDEDCKPSAEEEEDSLDFTIPRLVDKTVKNPNNFSRIDPHLLDCEDKLQAEYPLTANAKPAFCEVRQGEMLYLPASWLHEVSSFGSKNGHMALNYWFHPPDALDNFDNPYSTDFWPNDFRQRFGR